VSFTLNDTPTPPGAIRRWQGQGSDGAAMAPSGTKAAQAVPAPAHLSHRAPTRYDEEGTGALWGLPLWKNQPGGGVQGPKPPTAARPISHRGLNSHDSECKAAAGADCYSGGSAAATYYAGRSGSGCTKRYRIELRSWKYHHKHAQQNGPEFGPTQQPSLHYSSAPRQRGSPKFSMTRTPYTSGRGPRCW
jgi:hypothetical protein